MGSAHPKPISWQLDALPTASKRALDYLSRAAWLRRSRWYLAGGTALTLSVGHRQSVDLDFFSPEATFSLAALTKRFPSNVWKTDILREGTVYGKLLGTKVSFIAYPFFKASEPALWYGNVRVLPAKDIAVMKIVAISQRGKKRDFVDLYWYCKNRESLLDVALQLPRQYPTVAHNYHHIIKSLMYFTDAEADEMPRLFFPASWQQIKAYFQREVPRLARVLLKL